MQDYTVKRPGERDLAFTGELLGNVKLPGKGLNIEIEHSYTVYKTKGGKYVVDHTTSNKVTQEDIRNTAVFDDIEDVVNLVGWSDEAKEVYRKIGIDTEERID